MVHLERYIWMGEKVVDDERTEGEEDHEGDTTTREWDCNVEYYPQEYGEEEVEGEVDEEVEEEEEEDSEEEDYEEEDRYIAALHNRLRREEFLTVMYVVMT